MPDTNTQNPQADGDTSGWGLSIYDEMMAEIEPDLVSTAIDGLADKYANETDEEAAARAVRYNAAYAIFDTRLVAQKKEWDDTMHSFKRRAFASLEKDDRDKEMADGMAELDQQLASM